MKRTVILVALLFAISGCKKGGCESGGRIVGKWEHEYMTSHRVGKTSFSRRHHDFVLAVQQRHEEPASCPADRRLWQAKRIGDVLPPSPEGE